MKKKTEDMPDRRAAEPPVPDRPAAAPEAAARKARQVEPMAIEAALEAERMHRKGEAERRRVADLDLQQAEYDASLAERRYAACDPENRIIAAQLKKHWEAALRRVEACRSRLAAVEAPDPAMPMPNFEGLATDLAAVWSAPGVTTRSRQHLIRALISRGCRRCDP
jgi:hypothetical protein